MKEFQQQSTSFSMAEVEEPLPKRARGKSKEQRAHDKNHLFSTVQCKMNSIVHPDLDPTVREPFVVLIEKLVQEYTKLHQEACLFTELHISRCKRDNVTWPKCDQNFFSTVMTVLTGGTPQSTNPNSPEIVKTFKEHYIQCRPAGEPLVPNQYRLRLRGDLAKQLATSTYNHVVMNSLNRLKTYVKRQYGEARPKKFIYDAFNAPDVELSEENVDFKAMIKFNPLLDTEVERQWVHFHEKLSDVNLYFHERVAEREADPTLPREKSKTFHMIPKKQGFAPIFVHIHKSTLPEILKLLAVPEQQRLLELLQAQLPPGGDEYKIVQERREPRNARHSYFTEIFHQNEVLASALWRLLFRVDQFETVTRKFAYGISTDGYSASVTMQKPKPQGFVNRAEADFSYDAPPQGPDLRQFERLIGIDPGRTYTATSFDGERTTQVSNKEIRRNGKVDEFQAWERRLRKRKPEYAAKLAGLPTLKVTDFEELKQNIAMTLESSVFLLRFCAEQPFRKWRFKRMLNMNKAYHKAARKIMDVPIDPGQPRRKPRTLIGYGDWSNQDGVLRGTPKSGVKRLKRALRANGATVVMVDEFKTSKTCSRCFRTVENVSYNGVKCHQVVRCTNQACRAFWQRDFNAAMNIRECFVRLVTNQPRPAEMTRGAH